MGWYGVVTRVAHGSDIRGFLQGEADPARTVKVAKSEARRMLEGGDFRGEGEKNIRAWLERED